MRRFAIFILFMMVFAFSYRAQAIPQDTAKSLVLAIVQDEFSFDRSTIKRVELMKSNNTEYSNLHIKLKPAAAKQLEAITSAAMGKRITLIFNNKIISSATIQSSLKDNLQISGLSKNDAQEFIKSLHQAKRQQ